MGHAGGSIVYLFRERDGMGWGAVMIAVLDTYNGNDCFRLLCVVRPADRMAEVVRLDSVVAHLDTSTKIPPHRNIGIPSLTTGSPNAFPATSQPGS